MSKSPDPTPMELLKDALANRPQDIIVCYSKCWPCNFGDHDKAWHTWVDDEDVAHALSIGRPNPSSQRCGCYCQKDAKP
jgi:hypothetical protein